MHEDMPWLRFYGDIPSTRDYPRTTMYEAIVTAAGKTPTQLAYDFLDLAVTYQEFATQIDAFAGGLASLGLKKGDRITVCLPTCPQALIAFYAANKLGVAVSLIHPMCSSEQIGALLKLTGSTVAVALDDDFAKFEMAHDGGPLTTLVVTSLREPLPGAARVDLPRPSAPLRVERWGDLMRGPFPPAARADSGPDDLAAIMYSSGTTGVPKGIMLSNYNFISEGMMVFAWWKASHGDVPPVVAAVPPISHAFGLGVCCNAFLMNGGTTILVPEFTPAILCDIIRRKRPTSFAGVPVLFDALSRDPAFQALDLSCLRMVGCGSDTLPATVKERFDETVRRAGGDVKLVEGYGLTEAVSGILGTPPDGYREGSVGIPFPDIRAKIVRLGTMEEALPGQDGELCVHGPPVMLGYLNDPEGTRKVLQTHADGRVWLHTGDIFSMDEDGYVYFKLRLKRMIRASGANVYPTRVESVLYRHPDVQDACVIGRAVEGGDEQVKAVVVLKDPAKEGSEMVRALVAHCQRSLSEPECPDEVVFRTTLPLSPVGKVAYTVLVAEDLARRAGGGSDSARGT